MLTELLGKPVMIRTYSAGVHFGTLAKFETAGSEYSVKLTDANRIYSWSGACSLSQLSLEGSKDQESKISVQVPSIYLKAIEVIEMTEFALENLRAIPTWRSDKK